MSDKSAFTVTLDGKSISIPLSEARLLCPVEVEAMEKAGDQVSQTAERGDSVTMATATEELHRAMETLLHALAEIKRKSQL